MTSGLLGLDAREAQAILESAGEVYKVVDYVSARPYEDADARRVVRVAQEGGVTCLVVCSFKTKI